MESERNAAFAPSSDIPRFSEAPPLGRNSRDHGVRACPCACVADTSASREAGQGSALKRRVQPPWTRSVCHAAQGPRQEARTPPSFEPQREDPITQGCLMSYAPQPPCVLATPAPSTHAAPETQ